MIVKDNILTLSLIVFMFFITLLVTFSLVGILFPHSIYAAKYSVDQWSNIIAPLDSDVEFVLDNNDFPTGSNFEGNNIKFYLGEKKQRDVDKSNFFAFSGAQGFWDIQPYHVNKWKSDYNQELNGEQILERHFEMIKDSGAVWVRMDWMWSRIYKGELSECTDDLKYSYDGSDKVFRLAKKHNIKLLADLTATPKKLSTCEGCTWAQGYPWWAPKDIFQNNCVGGCSGLRETGSPCFNEFVKRMAERYRPGGDYYNQYPDADESYGITHWEIWNEPDIGFWNIPTQENIKSYLYLLKGAYQTISQIRSETSVNLKVLFGGLAYPEINLPKYYNEIGQDLNNYYDIMSAHRYDDLTSSGDQLLPSVVSQTRTILDSNGASDKSIWFTEVGGKYEPYQTSYLSGVLTDLYNSRSQYKLEKIFWWPSKDYYLYSDNFPAYIAGTYNEWGANAGFIKNFYRPKDSYLELAKMIQIANWKTYDRDLEVDNSITFTIPGSDLRNDKEYILFYSVLNKISTGKTINIAMKDLSSIPNCSNVSGPSTLALGASGTYSADFYSQQGNLTGEIFYGNLSRIEGQNLSGTSGSFSGVWKPEVEGVYNVCCRAWNDAIAECRPPDLVDGPPRYACQGPNYCTTVNVVKPSLMGDINQDDIVDIQDYILLSNAFGTSDQASDLNDDDIVDIQDYIILSNNFGNTS